MKTIFRRSSPVMTLIIVLTCCQDLPSPYDDTDAVIESRMEALNANGLIGCTFEGDQVTWINAYGFADRETQTEMTVDTAFQIGSISKVITGIAALQLFEQNALDLDKGINTYLATAISHPDFPNTAITARMLLTHTAGIIDNWELLSGLWGPGRSGYPLEDAVKNYFSAAGIWYDPDNNYSDEKPGTVWAYTNAGIGLLGYLVEIISGVPFEEYTRQYILDPLGVSGGWFLDEIGPSNLVTPYDAEGNALANDQGVFFPAGSYITTSRDLVKIMGIFANGGVSQGQRIIKSETVDLMLQGHYEAGDQYQGLILYRTPFTVDGQTVIGHAGTLDGIETQAFFSNSTNKGAIFFTNTRFAFPFSAFEILKALVIKAEAL